MSHGASADYEGIVVLGMFRSGTTLVRRLLNAHPSICCPPETNVLNACSRFLHEEPSSPNLTVGVLSGLAFSGIPEEKTLAMLRELALGVFRDIRDKNKKRRWAEKTAADIFHLHNIERLLGTRCRYICVVRHALDTVRSMMDLRDGMDRYIGELHRYIIRYASPSEAFAHAWNDANSSLLQFISDYLTCCITMRYEDLLQRPNEELTRVFEFLDEPTDVDTLIAEKFRRGTEVGLGDFKTYAKPGLDKGSIGRGGELAEDVVGRIARIVNPTMQALGYAAIPVSKSSGGEDARQRYRAMQLVNQMKASMQ